MPRKNLYRTDRLPYHITARANNREPFYLDQDQFWEIMGSECRIISLLFGVEFHALVLMPNHFHILLTTPAEDLGVAMTLFMKEVTKRVNRRCGRSGRIFGGPYFWTVINYTVYYRNVFKYVYRNPVKAGLVTSVEDYRYSTLHGLLGRSHLPVPIHFTRIGLEANFPSLETYELLNWLNTPTPSEAENLIRKGLSKTILDRLKCPNTRRPYEFLEKLI